MVGHSDVGRTRHCSFASRSKRYALFKVRFPSSRLAERLRPFLADFGEMIEKLPLIFASIWGL